MSSISDELVKHQVDKFVEQQYGEVKWLGALSIRIKSEMVELPKDRDGVPIHVGDTVYLEDGRMALVTEISIKRDWVAIDCWDESKHVTYDPSGITHVRHDSFERIADELDEMVDAADSADDRCEKLADLADRIRRLAEREG